MSDVIPPDRKPQAAVLKAQCELEHAARELQRAQESLALANQILAAHKAGLIFAPPKSRDGQQVFRAQ